MRIFQTCLLDQFEKFQLWSQDVYFLEICNFGYPHFLIKEVVGQQMEKYQTWTKKTKIDQR